tara:strand:- start:239 stop:1501 length:1263 start_codon:yes stop_codon:yes gene_type:complete
LPEIEYEKGKLKVENVDVMTIAKAVGTPFYCYSSGLMLRRYAALKDAFSAHNATIYYAVKANSNISVIKTLADAGAGADVVSLGELQRCMLAGVPASKIVFAGVGKTGEEILEAIKVGIFQINVESESELRLINDIAKSIDTVANIGLRVNPDVDAKTHEKITTGRRENKFGIDLSQAPNFFSIASSLPHVSLRSLSVHIGSQILDLLPFEKAYQKLTEMACHIRGLGYEIDHLDLGGGLGIPYSGELVLDLTSYEKIVRNTVATLGCRLSFEPGRYLVGESGILVTKVLHVKEGSNKSFIIVDGAMNDLIRPTLYDGYHEVIPVMQSRLGAEQAVCDIVGPICESGDYLAKDRMLPIFEQNDLIAVKCVGAYGAVMSSNYNSRPLTPEVLVRGEDFSLVKKRQTFEEFIRQEQMPEWLK